VTAIARAHPNIALVKYWGKRDEELILPETGSLSMTLDAFPTTTSVTLAPDAEADSFRLNGKEAGEKELQRVVTFLDHVRSLAGSSAKAKVESTNEVPTAAGLASSASGFAALALAAAAEYGLDLGERELSRLARRGSGSACRSVPGGTGFAVWRAGEDDETSYAEAVPAPDMRMVVLTLDAGSKPVSSREAMRRSAATSPYHDAWVSSTARTLVEAEKAAAAGDFTTLGELTEANALRMHAHINASFPPIRYLAPTSVAAIDTIAALRGAGVAVYATADAGPNVVAVCRPGDADSVAAALAPLGTTTIVAPGPGAALVNSDEPEGGPTA
jgi:diphosphomevalonate decarboxylase